jgi:hypothetical protein
MMYSIELNLEWLDYLIPLLKLSPKLLALQTNIALIKMIIDGYGST